MQVKKPSIPLSTLFLAGVIAGQLIYTAALHRKLDRMERNVAVLAIAADFAHTKILELSGLDPEDFYRPGEDAAKAAKKPLGGIPGQIIKSVIANEIAKQIQK